MTPLPNRHLRTDGRSTRASVVLAVIWVLLAGGVAGPEPAVAQADGTARSSLAERYQKMRLHVLVRRLMQREGGIRIFPPKPLPMSADSLRPSDPDSRASKSREKPFPVDEVRTVRRLERSWFRERFADTEWSFLGSTPHHTFFDTTQTRALRARLQDQFGDPTQTLGDAPSDTSRSPRPQFEYWFVVNDSIPVRVTDPEGPRGRGVILMAERPYRDRLRELREALLAPLRRAERGPYADYYYDHRLERWYRTGFDGRAFFLERISRSEIVPGRRAHLDGSGASSATPSPDDENSP